MVLNVPVDSDTANELYNPPPSSPDPYSNPDAFSAQISSISPYHIDLASIYSPAPIIGPLLGRGKESLANELQKRMVVMSAFQRRRLSQDEVDAFVYHTGKANAIASWGFPVGIMGGLYRANATKEQYGSPFTGSMKSENGWFDGQRIKLMGREVLRGDNARNFVHALRTVNHVSLHAGLVGLAAAIYASVVQFNGETNDPRLQDFFRTVKKNAFNAVAKGETMKQAGQGLGHPAPQSMIEKLKAQSRAQAQEIRAMAGKAATSSPTFNDDDASPLAAEQGYDEFVSDDNTAMSGRSDDAYNDTKNYNNYGDSAADTDRYNQTQTPNNQSQYQNQIPVRKQSSRSLQSSSSRAPSRPNPPPQYPRSDNGPSPPTDNSSSSSSSPSSPDDGPALSAWERIRRDAASGDSKWPSRNE